MNDYQYVGIRGVSLPKHDMFGSISILFQYTILWKFQKYSFEKYGKLNENKLECILGCPQQWWLDESGWSWCGSNEPGHCYLCCFLIRTSLNMSFSRYSMLVIISIVLTLEIFSAMIVIIAIFFFDISSILSPFSWGQLLVHTPGCICWCTSHKYEPRQVYGLLRQSVLVKYVNPEKNTDLQLGIEDLNRRKRRWVPVCWDGQWHSSYLSFFYTGKIFENKIYTEIYTVNCQFTQ